MASKGQKFQKYSLEIKEEILKKYLKEEDTKALLEIIRVFQFIRFRLG